MTDIALPIVNLNGTSREELQQLWIEAHDAVDAALTKLCKAMPHGRDYQVEGCDYRLARQQHERRLSALLAVKEELAVVAGSVMFGKSINAGERLLKVVTA